MVDPVIIAVDLGQMLGADAKLDGNLVRVPADNALVHLRAMSYDDARKWIERHPKLVGQLERRPEPGELLAVCIIAGYMDS